ncbi:MAG: hypothetical protein GY909_08550 [Oligoflexia bacterium]|nr:hypothetical protein [Oligoflexia bacterium]
MNAYTKLYNLMETIVGQSSDELQWITKLNFEGDLEAHVLSILSTNYNAELDFALYLYGLEETLTTSKAA